MRTLSCSGLDVGGSGDRNSATDETSRQPHSGHAKERGAEVFPRPHAGGRHARAHEPRGRLKQLAVDQKGREQQQSQYGAEHVGSRFLNTLANTGAQHATRCSEEDASAQGKGGRGAENESAGRPAGPSISCQDQVATDSTTLDNEWRIFMIVACEARCIGPEVRLTSLSGDPVKRRPIGWLLGSWAISTVSPAGGDDALDSARSAADTSSGSFHARLKAIRPSASST